MLALRNPPPKEDIFKRHQREHMDWPREISIETQALCNARCTFCPYPTMERKGVRMSDELLDRLVTEMIEFKQPLFFSPFKVNEPLLDARLIPMCERINREAPHIALRIFTNGSPLTPEKVEAIARLKRVVHLWVSLNSQDPEEYERIMGLKFEQTARRLDYLHSANFPHKVVLSTVGYPNEDFRRYCFDRWPDFDSFAIKKDSWLGFTEAQGDGVIPDTPCSRWFELSIMANGKVSLCCMSGEGEHVIGDLNEQTMHEVYNDPLWRARREKLMSRKELPVCQGCNY